MSNYLTKAKALEIFKRDYLPHIPKDDLPMKREEWNNFVDFLEKENMVNEKRSCKWSNPF